MNRSFRRRGFAKRIAGAAILVSGVALLGFATAAGGAHGLGAVRLTGITDPGCTPSAAGPGVVTVCLRESQEGTTAAAFATHSCDQVSNRNPALDYFIFVLPAAGDPGRVFTSPAPTVYFDSGTTSGVIGHNAKFFVASAAAGTTLLEAIANANNGTGTPKGGSAQVFNLTHTCPATTTTPTPTPTATPTATPTPTPTPTPSATPPG